MWQARDLKGLEDQQSYTFLAYTFQVYAESPFQHFYINIILESNLVCTCPIQQNN